MPEQDFLPYATTGADPNVEDQSDYASDPITANGAQSGKANSANFNKAMRQGTFWGAVLATMIVDQLDIAVLDDGVVATKVTAIQNAILALTAIYAPINNPTLTGTAAAPTVAGSTDSTTKIATTAFVQACITALSNTLTTAINLKAPLNSPGLTGTPTAPTPTTGDDTTKLATTAFVQNELAVQPFKGFLAFKWSGSGVVVLGESASLISSITRNSVGNYTIVLDGSYDFLCCTGQASYTTGSNSQLNFAASNGGSAGNATINVWLSLPSEGSTAQPYDPLNNCVIQFSAN